MQPTPPPCPRCNGPTQLPTPSPAYGGMLVARCVCIADHDWCVLCPTCKLHLHLPGMRAAPAHGTQKAPDAAMGAGGKETARA